MYQILRKHPLVSELFVAPLVDVCGIDGDYVATHRREFVAHLEEEFELGASYNANKADWFAGRWSGLYAPKDEGNTRRNVDSGVTSKLVDAVGRAIPTLPADVNAHKTTARVTAGPPDMSRSGHGP